MRNAFVMNGRNEDWLKTASGWESAKTRNFYLRILSELCLYENFANYINRDTKNYLEQTVSHTAEHLASNISLRFVHIPSTRWLNVLHIGTRCFASPLRRLMQYFWQQLKPNQYSSENSCRLFAIPFLVVRLLKLATEIT